MKPLWQCRTEGEQVAWTIAAGHRVCAPFLWRGGVDRPVRTVGRVKAVPQAAGLRVASAIEIVKDVEGEDHETMTWHPRPPIRGSLRKGANREQATRFDSGLFFL